MTRLLFVLVLSVCLLPVPVKASAVKSLKTFVNKALTFQANFSQTLLDKNFQVIRKASGSMMFERPGKFRWTYDQPYQQLIVGDGKQVWFYDQDLAQVTVHRLDQALGSTPAALLAGAIPLNATLTCRKSTYRRNRMAGSDSQESGKLV